MSSSIDTIEVNDQLLWEAQTAQQQLARLESEVESKRQDYYQAIRLGAP